MSAYSKLIGGIVGNIVGMVLVYLAAKGLAVCNAQSNGLTACTVFGLSDVQITAVIMTIVNAVGVHYAPPNTPPPAPVTP